MQLLMVDIGRIHHATKMKTSIPAAVYWVLTFWVAFAFLFNFHHRFQPQVWNGGSTDDTQPSLCSFCCSCSVTQCGALECCNGFVCNIYPCQCNFG
jgi:hypothetical protein